MNLIGLTSTKRFHNFPCAHRQWGDEGHCRFIHGYSRSFIFSFAASALQDKTQFVMHFGELDWLKKLLDRMFDHTLLVNEDDPELDVFKELHYKQLADLRILPNVSCEHTSQWLLKTVNNILCYQSAIAEPEAHNPKRLIVCYRVECHENDKNSGEFSESYDRLISSAYDGHRNLRHIHRELDVNRSVQTIVSHCTPEPRLKVVASN